MTHSEFLFNVIPPWVKLRAPVHRAKISVIEINLTSTQIVKQIGNKIVQSTIIIISIYR